MTKIFNRLWRGISFLAIIALLVPSSAGAIFIIKPLGDQSDLQINPENTDSGFTFIKTETPKLLPSMISFGIEGQDFSPEVVADQNTVLNLKVTVPGTTYDDCISKRYSLTSLKINDRPVNELPFAAYGTAIGDTSGYYYCHLTLKPMLGSDMDTTEFSALASGKLSFKVVLTDTASGIVSNLNDTMDGSSVVYKKTSNDLKISFEAYRLEGGFKYPVSLDSIPSRAYVDVIVDNSAGDFEIYDKGGLVSGTNGKILGRIAAFKDEGSRLVFTVQTKITDRSGAVPFDLLVRDRNSGYAVKVTPDLASRWIWIEPKIVEFLSFVSNDETSPKNIPVGGLLKVFFKILDDDYRYIEKDENSWIWDKKNNIYFGYDEGVYQFWKRLGDTGSYGLLDLQICFQNKINQSNHCYYQEDFLESDLVNVTPSLTPLLPSDSEEETPTSTVEKNDGATTTMRSLDLGLNDEEDTQAPALLSDRAGFLGIRRSGAVQKAPEDRQDDTDWVNLGGLKSGGFINLFSGLDNIFGLMLTGDLGNLEDEADGTLTEEEQGDLVVCLRPCQEKRKANAAAVHRFNLEVPSIIKELRGFGIEGNDMADQLAAYREKLLGLDDTALSELNTEELNSVLQKMKTVKKELEGKQARWKTFLQGLQSVKNNLSNVDKVVTKLAAGGVDVSSVKAKISDFRDLIAKIEASKNPDAVSLIELGKRIEILNVEIDKIQDFANVVVRINENNKLLSELNKNYSKADKLVKNITLRKLAKDRVNLTSLLSQFSSNIVTLKEINAAAEMARAGGDWSTALTKLEEFDSLLTEASEPFIVISAMDNLRLFATSLNQNLAKFKSNLAKLAKNKKVSKETIELVKNKITEANTLGNKILKSIASKKYDLGSLSQQINDLVSLQSSINDAFVLLGVTNAKQVKGAIKLPDVIVPTKWSKLRLSYTEKTSRVYSNLAVR